MPRNEAIAKAKVAGWHNNILQFARILEETSEPRSVVDVAWHDGRKRAASGEPCACVRCVEGW